MGLFVLLGILGCKGQEGAKAGMNFWNGRKTILRGSGGQCPMRQGDGVHRCWRSCRSHRLRSLLRAFYLSFRSNDYRIPVHASVKLVHRVLVPQPVILGAAGSSHRRVVSPNPLQGHQWICSPFIDLTKLKKMLDGSVCTSFIECIRGGKRAREQHSVAGWCSPSPLPFTKMGLAAL